MFVVAVARLVFDTAHITSLKEKRRLRLQISQRLRNRFPASVAEIESNDNHSRLVLGVSVVSNNARHGAAVIDSIVGFVGKLYLAPLELWEREVLNLGTLEDPFWDCEDPVDLDWEQTKETTKDL